jgi:hypothetical protein
MDKGFKYDRKEYSILWLVIIFILLVFILVGTIRNNYKDNSVDQYIKVKQNQLDLQYKSSQQKIDSLLIEVKKNQKQLEELQINKQKIRLVYVQNDNKIDTLNYVGIVDLFKVIFAKSDIK